MTSKSDHYIRAVKKRFICKYERDLLTCQLFLWVPQMWLADATSVLEVISK